MRYQPEPTLQPAMEETQEAAAADKDEETVVVDNGSIRAVNSDKYKVPTFVRKQMD